MKIYLSPAAHAADNRTQCPVACSENTHANAYMDVLERRLRALGIEVKRGSAALTGADAMRARVKEANAWGADIYYVAHTNAGGGRYSMTMCWPNEASRAKAEILHRHRTCVASHKVVTNSELYEIKQTKMVCLYDELFFHDNAEDCAWFHSGGMEKLAEETAAAMCEIGGVAYKPPVAEKPAEKKPAATVTKPAEKKPAATVTKPAAPAKPVVIAPKAGDVVKLEKGKLYHTARGGAYVTRTGTFYIYDGVKVGNRYRVTNKKESVGKSPVSKFVSGWVEA